MVTSLRALIVAFFLLFAAPVAMAESAIPGLLQSYEAEGASHFDAKAGEAMWHKQFPAPADEPEDTKPRNCQTCHGVDLTKAGAHARTGKVIDPMALSANPERYTDAKKVEKWFLRNCKWVLGRTCTAQEKGDFLTYLQHQ